MSTFITQHRITHAQRLLVIKHDLAKTGRETLVTLISFLRTIGKLSSLGKPRPSEQAMESG